MEMNSNVESSERIDRKFGREAFGDDPKNYHTVRPAYPEDVWEVLRARANLRSGIDILEIGAGTGLATVVLAAHQPKRFVAIEPDSRLASFLRSEIPDPRLEILVEPFESADLKAESFELIVCATAFHWLDEASALRRFQHLLRPGGAVAIWWNVFGDTGRPDPFHDATTHLFPRGQESPSSGDPGRPPFALDFERRLKELSDAGFQTDPVRTWHWPLILDPTGVWNLYNTFSNVTVLPSNDRATLLDALAEVAKAEFGGIVERNMTTALYVGFKNAAI